MNVIQLLAAVVFILFVIRIGYILSANPIGELAAEVVYLRTKDLRAPGILLFLGLVLEMSEFVFPFLADRGLVPEGAPAAAVFYVNAVQALFLLFSLILIVFVVGRYTHRGLDRRIRQSMDTLAYLAGQRRRRQAIRSSREDEIVREAMRKRRS